MSAYGVTMMEAESKILSESLLVVNEALQAISYLRDTANRVHKDARLEAYRVAVREHEARDAILQALCNAKHVADRLQQHALGNLQEAQAAALLVLQNERLR